MKFSFQTDKQMDRKIQRETDIRAEKDREIRTGIYDIDIFSCRILKFLIY
jgi:hypothetical protein